MHFTTIATYPNSPYKIGDPVREMNHHGNRVFLVSQVGNMEHWEHAETLLSMPEVFKQH